MKNCIVKGLVILVCLVVVAGAILWTVKELSETVVETIDDSNDVKNYTVFIDDCVRYTLSCAHPDYAYIGSNAELESKADRKIEEYASAYDADQPSYKLALEKLGKEGNSFEKNYAIGLLKKYNGLKIDLTPFEKDKEKAYKYRFKERNSRVNFTVSVGVLCSCDADIWDLGRYTEYLETGVFEEAPTSSNDEPDEELGRGDLCEDVDVDPAVELIHARICDQYNGWYTDDKIMSKSFYTLFRKAQQTDDSEIGWPDWSYWECSNGAYAELSTVEVELKSSSTAVAHIVLSYPENSSSLKVDMPMVYENGNWFVDDIISYEKDGKFSLRKSAESILDGK